MANRLTDPEGFLSTRRIRAFARAFQSEDARFAAACTRALHGLEGGGGVPAELLPMGARMLTRGLLTARALSVGRERPWPYAFVRQLDPEDPGFLPRSLLPMHLNLSYRNWTTIGLPGWKDEAIVDPGGWLTPWRDGPSVAVWVGDSRNMYTLGPLPGWGADTDLSLSQKRLGSKPMVRTLGQRGEVEVEVDVYPAVVDGRLVFGLTARARLVAPAPRPVRLAIAIRPANPEGIAPIFDLERGDDGWWLVNGEPFLYLPHAGDEHCLSTWRTGEVYAMVGGMLRDERQRPSIGSGGSSVNCEAGLAMGCEVYRTNLSPGETFKRTVYASADKSLGDVLRRSSATRLVAGVKADWEGVVRAGSRIELPVHDRLFRVCRTTVLSLCDGDSITAGPLTYHDFWYRDAAYMLSALTRVGHARRALQVQRAWPSMQERSGAWLSQAREWDGSGQAIWSIMDTYRHTGDGVFLRQMYPSISKAARWICRTQKDGMMPSGWSAEHLGPADSYFWDALWCCAGLRDAAEAAERVGRRRDAREWLSRHGDVLELLRMRMGDGPVPAAPGRSMDSAAISVLAAVWPLGLFSAGEQSMRRTVTWLREHCMHEGGLFHDVVHSGVNAYLTCHLAQARLLDGDSSAVQHLDYLAEHATATGCWPEAFHPQRGGVMGDGDHGWAAADFISLCRNLVVYEEGGVLHLFRATDRRWFNGLTIMEDVPTRFGAIDLRAEAGELRLVGRWRERPKRIVWHKPAGEMGHMFVEGAEVRGEGAQLEMT